MVSGRAAIPLTQRGKEHGMRCVLLTLTISFALHGAAMFTVAAQVGAQVPPAFTEMADAERAFVKRAQEVSISQAFIEFFADDAVGFQSGQPASAQLELRKQPSAARDPNQIFWWEPRYGDIAASGELGWLTGPVRMGRKDKDAGKVRHGNYTSIWKRQADGRFKVIIDIGTDPPGEVPFAPGLTRAPFAERFTGGEIGPLAESSLLAADRALNSEARTSRGEAYKRVAAAAIRVHRNGHLPFEGREAAVAWLSTQPPFAAAETLYAEVAKSADLGYTWGSYELAADPGGKAAGGHYTRVWVREMGGTWRLALDLDAPRRNPA
jgi:ketosteroid isomerase-like protein